MTMKYYNPPKFKGWQTLCRVCDQHSTLKCMKERDADNAEVYYDYVCSKCLSIILTIQRTEPQEREARSPNV
jgi:predicted SprT family Zn-dependent metalloprotease